MKLFLEKIYNSFITASKGQESMKNMIWWWGILSYLIAFFIVDLIIKKNDSLLIDSVISFIVCVYYAWHLYALRRCAPKKPKLTDEEKKILKNQRSQEMYKSFFRKLFLKEPITKWNTITVITILDILFFCHFGTFVLR
jgi:hypothetical protein